MYALIGVGTKEIVTDIFRSFCPVAIASLPLKAHSIFKSEIVKVVEDATVLVPIKCQKWIDN